MNTASRGETRRSSDEYDPALVGLRAARSQTPGITLQFEGLCSDEGEIPPLAGREGLLRRGDGRGAGPAGSGWRAARGRAAQD